MYFSVRLPGLGINVSFFEGGREGEVMNMFLPTVSYLLLGKTGTKCMKALECHSAPTLYLACVFAPHTYTTPPPLISHLHCLWTRSVLAWKGKWLEEWCQQSSDHEAPGSSAWKSHIQMGKTEGRRMECDGWLASLTQWTLVWASSRR